MKSSNFFIKSNYIKNTKDNWVFCEGRLFYHQNITFLHLKSINQDRTSSAVICDTDSNCSGFSTLSRQQQYRSRSKQKETRLNILCNLLEFKSCEIKSVNYKYVNKFAIKLVPSSFLSSKKLYLLPDLEDSLTEWCGLLTGFITKTINFPITESRVDDRSMTLSSTLKTLNTPYSSNAFPQSNSVYISLDENDAYESSNQNEYYSANIEPSEDSIKLNLRGQYVLKLSIDCIELMNPSTRESIHTFPYSSIRRFGAKDSMFRLEAGRHCSTGNGSFTFQVKDAVQIAEKLKENAKQIKNNKNAHSSCMTLNRPSTLDASLQVETKRDSSLNSKRSSISITPTLNQIDNSDNISMASEHYECPRTPQNIRKEIQDSDSINTVVEENDIINNSCITPVEISEERKNNSENLNGEALYNHVSEGITKEDSLKVEDLCTEKIENNIEQNTSIDINDMEKDKTVQIRNTTSLVIRHENVVSSSDFISHSTDEIENTNSKEIRPMSLFETSSYESSLHNSTSPSISSSPFRNYTPLIKDDYKVSDSTFFKYRILTKPPIPIPTFASLTDQSLTSYSYTRPIKMKPVAIDNQSPKRSPPPLLPKPKFKLTDENYDQNSYREFDQMLKDLQLSLS